VLHLKGPRVLLWIWLLRLTRAANVTVIVRGAGEVGGELSEPPSHSRRSRIRRLISSYRGAPFDARPITVIDLDPDIGTATFKRRSDPYQ